MQLKDCSVLVLSDDKETIASVQEALGPLVKALVAAKDTSDAVGKATNAQFDLIILRTKESHLAKTNNLFSWCQMKKNYRKVPWIVWGDDIEPKDILVNHRHVKFIEKGNRPELIRIMEGMLFSPDSSAKTIDVNFLNPLVSAVVEVLKSMAQLDLTRGAPYVKTPTSPQMKGDISGIIGMNADRFAGSMAICFPQKAILKIYEAMLGTEAKDISEDVKDCVMELTNIIFGAAKRDLNAVGHTLQAALPSVVTGPGHEIRHSVSGTCICIPFDSPHGKILVECVISSIDA